MKVCRQSNAQWFEAVIEGDVYFIQANMHQCCGQSDDRPADFAPKVIPHFTALLYAIYYNRLSIVELLFYHEYNITTRGPARVYAPSTRQTVLLAPGSTALHVVLLTQNSQILQFIAQQLKDQFYAQYFVGRQNGFKQTVSHFAFLNYSFSAATLCYSDQLFETEFAMMDKTNSTPLMLACYIGKHVYAMKAKNHFAALRASGDTAKIRKLGANIFKKNQMGMDIFDVCQLEVDERLKATVEYGSKGKCCEIVREIHEWYQEVAQKKRGTRFNPTNSAEPESQQEDAQLEGQNTAYTHSQLTYYPYQMQQAPPDDFKMSSTQRYTTNKRSAALFSPQPPSSYDQLTQSYLGASARQ